MMAHSHVVFGLSLWTIGAELAGVPALEPAAIALTAAGALLPDIDHPGSWFGRRLLFISLPLALIVGHRGVTHSLIAVAAGIGALLYYGLDGYAAPLVVGYLSHLLGDAFTPSGVPLLWPLKPRFSLNLMRTNSLVEHIGAAALTMTLFWYWGTDFLGPFAGDVPSIGSMYRAFVNADRPIGLLR
ncbi:MAG TPA: metal-dependent hydrolase [Rhizomicrobium sp.]|nr:metal-dependent hydrolase [Rhizomicrobium sp.]